MSDANKQILERANAAIAAGDFDGFLSFCTDDTTWNFVGERVLEGKQAVRDWMVSAYKEPPRFEVHRMISEGDVLCAVGEITLKDERGGATRHAYCDVWRFRGDKLAELHAFVVEGMLDSAAFCRHG